VLARPAQRSLAARIFGGLGWAAAGAAAAIAVLMWLPHFRQSAASGGGSQSVAEGGSFQATESERELVDATDDGVRYVDGEEPMRQVRYTYVVRHIWTNAATGARVEVEVPREDVFLMPVAMQ
jgi:hypothetical protein